VPSSPEIFTRLLSSEEINIFYKILNNKIPLDFIIQNSKLSNILWTYKKILTLEIEKNNFYKAPLRVLYKSEK